MIAKLKPTYIFERIEDIPFELFEENNITGIIFDADNTIVDYTHVLSDSKKEWIKTLKEKGYNICILSNSGSEKKIRELMRKLDVNGLLWAMKPLLKGFKMAISILDSKKDNVIMIGDQLFTDIYGANRFGIKSIFVYPIHKREDPITTIKRPLENYILNKYLRDTKKEEK